MHVYAPKMAKVEEDSELAFFVMRCRGVKFYNLVGGSGTKFGSKVRFVRSHYPKDHNCIEELVGGKKLGNVVAEAAE